MNALTTMYKSRKVMFLNLIKAFRHVNAYRIYHDKKLYRYNFESSINIESILNCGKEYFKKEEIESLEHKSRAARSALAELTSQVKESSNTIPGKDIKKVVWMFWDKGIESAPDVVKLSYQSWVKQNPDYEVRLLDNDSIRSIADFDTIFSIASLNLGLAQKTDYIRTYLLARYGGVWADSTTFCWKPLSDWLPEATSKSGFFVFRQPKSRPDRQIASWFIASQAGNPVLVNLFILLSDYIFKSRCINLEMIKYKYYSHYQEVSHETGNALIEKLERANGFPYHLIHYLFNEAVKDPAANSLWKSLRDERNEFVGSNGRCDSVLVSKQSYKGKYPNSSTYLEREKKLRDALNIQ